MATTLTNISQFISAGFADAQFSISNSGLPYDAGNLPAQTEGVGMTNVPGVKTANVNFPAATVTQIPGDDGVRGVIQFAPAEQPTFDLVTSDLTMSFVNTLQGTTTIDAQSIYDFLVLDPAEREFIDLFMMLTRRSVSTEAGSEGNGFDTVLFPLCTVSYQGPSGYATGDGNPGEHTFNVAINRVTQTPWGGALGASLGGTTGVSGFIFWSQDIPTFDVYRHDGTDTAYTPTKTLANNEQVIAWNDIAGTTATLSTTVSSGDFTFTAETADDLTLFMYETK